MESLAGIVEYKSRFPGFGTQVLVQSLDAVIPSDETAGCSLQVLLCPDRLLLRVQPCGRIWRGEEERVMGWVLRSGRGNVGSRSSSSSSGDDGTGVAILCVPTGHALFLVWDSRQVEMMVVLLVFILLVALPTAKQGGKGLA